MIPIIYFGSVDFRIWGFTPERLSATMPCMTESTPRRPENTRGRKRDSGRTEAILKAAAALLLDVGFDRFRIQDVATRAGSGTGAIYRRWPTKESLIIEAIRNMPERKAPVTDDPVADLRAVVSPECINAAEKPDLVPGLISAMRADAGIKDVVKEGFTLARFRHPIARVLGEDHPHLNLLAELIPAIPLLRSSFSPESLEPEAMTDEIVSLILSLAEVKRAE